MCKMYSSDSHVIISVDTDAHTCVKRFPPTGWPRFLIHDCASLFTPQWSPQYQRQLHIYCMYFPYVISGNKSYNQHWMLIKSFVRIFYSIKRYVVFHQINNINTCIKPDLPTPTNDYSFALVAPPRPGCRRRRKYTFLRMNYSVLLCTYVDYNM